ILARDLRILVREQLKAGNSDQAVRDYMVARYGDYVLLRPPMKLETVLLWFGPFIALFLGAGVVYYFARRARGGAAVEVAPLNDAERARLALRIASAHIGR